MKQTPGPGNEIQVPIEGETVKQTTGPGNEIQVPIKDDKRK